MTEMVHFLSIFQALFIETYSKKKASGGWACSQVTLALLFVWVCVGGGGGRWQYVFALNDGGEFAAQSDLFLKTILFCNNWSAFCSASLVLLLGRNLCNPAPKPAVKHAVWCRLWTVILIRIAVHKREVLTRSALSLVHIWRKGKSGRPTNQQY